MCYCNVLKGKYKKVGVSASVENYHRGQVAKLIREWGNNGVGAALHEVLCEPVDLILPAEELEHINNMKGNF